MNRNVFLGVVCLLCLSVATFTLTAGAQSTKLDSVVTAPVWEYKSFQRTVYSGGLDIQLNEWGSQGWELCGVHPAQMTPDDVPTPTVVYVFKRVGK